MFSIQMLPAREGDTIWVRWGDEHTPYQMLVDTGTEAAGKELNHKISELPESQRKFEAIVVTHIDADHIGGLLSCFIDCYPPLGVEVGDYWFNGYKHLDGRRVSSDLEKLGAVQAERLTEWLKTQPWNKSFEGGSICRQEGEPLKVVELAGGMKITVLGPRVDRLESLKPEWDKEIRLALQKSQNKHTDSGLESMGPDVSVDIPDAQSLQSLANQRPLRDTKAANGSSIILLLEYDGKKVLLAGDAFAEDLVEAMLILSSESPLKLDAFKVPHHCSRANISKQLIEAVDCSNWLISTDGSRHKHPDDEGIASILCYRQKEYVNLIFNVPSVYNSKWSNPKWQQLFFYSSKYGSGTEGYVLSF
ncbi:hypothetical protein ACVWV0_000305 [Ewingella americana]